MANEYKVRVRHCPDDEELGYPRFTSGGSGFVGTDFMESLYGGVFPKYMIVEFIGPPFGAPDADRTLWTIGPHPFKEGRQVLYEYGGVRILASKSKKPSTLIEITEEVAMPDRIQADGTEYFTFAVEIVVESESEDLAVSAVQGILSDYEMADGTLINWDFLEST